jgi:phenylacetate-CoA ligase
MSDHVSEQDRFPLLNDAGRAMLDRLRQHPHAPRYNYHCGEKLSASGLQRVRDFAARLHERPSSWSAEPPDWLIEYTRMCLARVPFYRNRHAGRWRGSAASVDFSAIPLIERSDLRREPWSFVPDTADISDLIVYSTSGTTGNLLKVICDPTVPACYLPLIEHALGVHGVTIEGGPRVSIVHVAAQRSTYTLASVMSYFDFAGFAKVNLHATAWNHPESCQAFLNDCAAEVYTGDPFALEQLSHLGLAVQPKAIVSSATTLLPALRETLEQRFACPVIDMISMNETGPIAFSIDGQHRIFPHRIYVEIIDQSGQPARWGERGEIVVTGGINPLMPLLRYRTGDFAALALENGQPVLERFTGRTPVHFVRSDGDVVRSIDVVVALYDIPLPLFRLHQHRDGRLVFQTRCDAPTARQLHDRLGDLFGPGSHVDIEQIPEEEVWTGKSIQFSTDRSEQG